MRLQGSYEDLDSQGSRFGKHPAQSDLPGIFNHFFSGFDRLPFRVVFDSAGIDVDKIMANATPATKKLGIIYAGRSYDLIKGGNMQLADELLGMWLGKNEALIPEKEKERITRLYSDIKTGVHMIQMRFRNEALLDAGIPERCLPGMRAPFRHDENLRLILPVEESVFGKVDDFYGQIKTKRPITRLYGSLAGISPLEDELTGGIETARKQVRYFMDTRDKAMEEIVTLLSENETEDGRP